MIFIKTNRKQRGANSANIKLIKCAGAASSFTDTRVTANCKNPLCTFFPMLASGTEISIEPGREKNISRVTMREKKISYGLF